MNTILALHSTLSNTTWLFFLLLGVWGSVRALRQQGVDGSYLGAMIIGQLLFVLQAVFGFFLWFAGPTRPDRGGIHLLYGLFALVFLPGLFTYIKGDDTNRAQWVYALGSLFLVGIAFRLIELGV